MQHSICVGVFENSVLLFVEQEKEKHIRWNTGEYSVEQLYTREHTGEISAIE